MFKISLLYVFCIVLSLAQIGLGNPGGPDPAFGAIGLITNSLSADSDRAYAVARQVDGKIVAAGTRGGMNMAVVRYLPDGTLDQSFDGDGVFTISGSLFGNQANGLAIQPDGKIVVVGTFSSSFLVVIRLNPNGSLDTTFDGDGIFTDLQGTAGYSVIMQPDGKIVAVGDAPGSDVGGSTRDILAVRLNTDGSLDALFDGDGRARFGMSRANVVGVAESAALQTDGKIVIATESNNAFGLARLNPDGSLDTSFDGDGKVRTEFASGFRSFANAVAIDPEGRIVAVGYAGDGSIQGGAVARYLPDGSLDATVDGDGKVITPAMSLANAVIAQPDGKIVAAGYTLGTWFSLIRYNVQGGLDTSFGNGGVVETVLPPAGDSLARAATLAPDGKIFVVGNANKPALDEDFALARFRPDGTLIVDDGRFGRVVTNPFNATTQASEATAVAVQQDGKIVTAANRVINATTTGGAIIRYLPDGRLDRTFASSTFGAAPIYGSFATNLEMTSIAVQQDGKIFAAGNWETDSDAGIFVVQLNPDGIRNGSFGERERVRRDKRRQRRRHRTGHRFAARRKDPCYRRRSQFFHADARPGSLPFQP